MLLKRPGNVLLANNGPAVIDWAKVARGPVGADVADHLVIAGGGSFIKRPPRPGCRHPLDDTCSPVRSCRWSIAPRGLATWLPSSMQQYDPHLTGAELDRMASIVRRHRISPSGQRR